MTRFHITTLHGCSMLALLLCAGIGPSAVGGAYAQTSPASEAEAADQTERALDKVVVTARKREERLSDIPETVKLLTAEDLEKRSITTLEDLSRQTPSLQLSKRQDNNPQVVIRGIGSFGNVQGVGFYIDEVQNFTDQTAPIEDVERIEILKGPQGTLYGGNSIGGAIRFIIKEPEFTPSAMIKGEAGTENYQKAYGSLTGPFVSDKLAGRISGYWTHDDGFVENVNLGGKPSDEFRDAGFRAQLLWQPIEQLDALFTLKHRSVSGGANSYTRQDGINDPIYESRLTFDPEGERETWSGIANLEYDLGTATLNSITSYTRQTTSWVVDADYGPAPAQAALTTDANPSEVYTQELRLSSNDGGRFDWIVGLYGDRVENIIGFPAPIAIEIGGGAVRLDPFLDRKSRQTDLAAFGTLDAHLGRFTLGAGARLNHSEFKLTRYVEGGAPVQGTVEVDDTAVLPKFSLAYEVRDGTNLYATVAQGYESGKVSVDSTPPTGYAPEKAWSYEVGAKGDIFGGDLYYEVAAYHIDYQDRQIETRTLANSLVVETIANIGDSTSNGGEASLMWSPSNQLTLNGGIGYLDATWDQATFNFMPLDGRKVPNSPEWTANIAADYSIPVGNMFLDIHGDASYTDKFKWKLVDTPNPNTNPSYWLANVRIALGPQDDNWQVAARIENLFDEEYYREFTPQFFGPANADGTCDQCHLGSLGPRRRFVVSVQKRF